VTSPDFWLSIHLAHVFQFISSIICDFLFPVRLRFLSDFNHHSKIKELNAFPL